MNPGTAVGTTMIPRQRPWEKIMLFFKMIDFHETIFAMPFAYTGALLGSWGGVSWAQIGWITLAMVGARTVAMAFNRMIDVEFDARNPRTANAIMPRGLLSRAEVWGGIILAAALFFYAAAQLAPWCLPLSPLALIFITFYSYTKRFTWLTHYILGLALSLAPLGGWLAVANHLPYAAFTLGLGVAFWVAGFDIIFALQDAEADRAEGLYSIPARFGIPKALVWSSWSHVLTVVFFAATGLLLNLAWPYWIGVGVMSLLLIIEHRLLSPDDLSLLHTAYFRVNGLISVVFLAFTWWALNL